MKTFLFLVALLISQFAIGQCDELDSSYNGDGVLAIHVGNQSGTDDRAIATFVTEDQILVVGNILVNSIRQGGVAYFNHEGEYIKKLKIGTSQFISNDYIVQAACLQHDGKLLVTGHVGTSFGKGPVFIARANVDGTMDDSFGTSGLKLVYSIGTDFNYMTNIIQEPDGKITAIGRGREHGEDLQALKVTCDATGDEASGSVFGFASFISFGSYEFINGTAFKVHNAFDRCRITYFSGEPFPVGTNDTFEIDASVQTIKLLGLSILSNNRLAAHGYIVEDDEEYPIVYVFDETGNLDLSFNNTGFKILDQSGFNATDIILYEDIYYITTSHSITGASIHKLNLDGSNFQSAVGNPFYGAYPVVDAPKMFLKDSTFFIAGEVYYDDERDFGLAKFRPCGYEEFVFDEYPFTPIKDLKEIDADGVPLLEGTFTTRGVVSSINFSSSHRAFISIIDQENEGIFIEGDTTDFAYLPQLGDEILISGILQTHFESTAELFWRYYRIDSKDNSIISPIEVPELNTYSEGVYVNLQNVTLTNDWQWKGDGTTFTVDATNGTQNFTIKVFENSYWSNQPAPLGTLSVSGIGGQNDPSIPYFDNFEIYPQFESDISGVTSIVELSDKNLSIYPNPASTKLYINALDIPNPNFLAMDTGGRTFPIPFDGNALDISALASGFYILLVKDGEGEMVKRARFVVR